MPPVVKVLTTYLIPADLGDRMVLKFRSHASGLFALSKDIKVKQGSICVLRCDRENIYGESCLLLDNGECIAKYPAVKYCNRSGKESWIQHSTLPEVS